VFGSWAGVDPDSLDAKWMIGFHVLYSFVFGIVFVNVLIAIVSDSFAKIENESRAINTF
jgi:hypothetical protein